MTCSHLGMSRKSSYPNVTTNDWGMPQVRCSSNRRRSSLIPTHASTSSSASDVNTTGNPKCLLNQVAKIDETILSSLPFPEAQRLARSFMLQKRLGMLAEGNNAWMQLVDKDGKLRHTINLLAQSQVVRRVSNLTYTSTSSTGTIWQRVQGTAYVPKDRVLVGADCLASSYVALRITCKTVVSLLVKSRLATSTLKHAEHGSERQKPSKDCRLLHDLRWGNQRLGEIAGRAAEGKIIRDRFTRQSCLC